MVPIETSIALSITASKYIKKGAQQYHQQKEKVYRKVYHNEYRKVHYLKQKSSPPMMIHRKVYIYCKLNAKNREERELEEKGP